MQDTDTLKIAFATQMENAELEKVQITKDSVVVESEKVLAQDGKTLSIIPKAALEKGGEYVLTVNEASDIFGNSIKENFTFTVAPEGYVRYDEVSLSGVPDVLWENTNETVSVNTQKDGAAGVLDASLYEVASSNQAVIKVTQQNGGYRLSAVGEGAAIITVKSPLYGEINGFTKYVLVCDGYANKTVSSMTGIKAQTLFGETIYVTDENASITYGNVDGNEGESAQEFWISYVNLSGKQAAAKVTANGKTQTVILEKSKNSQDVKAVKVSVSMAGRRREPSDA